jgi:hypothetical protein
MQTCSSAAGSCRRPAAKGSWLLHDRRLDPSRFKLAAARKTERCALLALWRGNGGGPLSHPLADPLCLRLPSIVQRQVCLRWQGLTGQLATPVGPADGAPHIANGSPCEHLARRKLAKRRPVRGNGMRQQLGQLHGWISPAVTDTRMRMSPAVTRPRMRMSPAVTGPLPAPSLRRCPRRGTPSRGAGFRRATRAACGARSSRRRGPNE